MISWISYTTATVSAAFQGVKSFSYSGESQESYASPARSKGGITDSTNFTISGSETPVGTTYNRGRTYTVSYHNRESLNEGGVGFTHYTRIHSRNSQNFTFVNHVVGLSTSSGTTPKQTVTQYTTTTSMRSWGGRQKRTTGTALGYSRLWTTAIENETVTTVRLAFSQVRSTFQSYITGPFVETFITLQGTTEFITWTDLVEDQIVVGHTIWEDSSGFAFFTRAQANQTITPEQLDDFNSDNTGCGPISQASWQTATRTTQSYSPYYIKLHAVQEGADGSLSDIPTLTKYGLFGVTWASHSDDWQETGRPTIPFTTNNTLVVGYKEKLPFTTTNQPEWWSEEYPDGDEQWHGNAIYKVNTLQSVLTSVTAVYGNVQFNRSYSTNFSSLYTSESIWTTHIGSVGASAGATNGTAYERRGPELLTDLGNPNVYMAIFNQGAAFGSPDLNFAQTTFSDYPLFLELNGAKITLNDLYYFGYPVVYAGLDAPFALPSFTAYAKPTLSEADDEGYTYSYYGAEQSDWTTVTVERIGASFSSSWVWNINSSSTTSDSGIANLQAKHQIPVGLGVYNLNDIVLGGAQFPHATMTISKKPGVFLMTTYNKSTSGTSSSIEKCYSVVTTEQAVGSTNLTVFRCIPFARGYGMRTQALWEIDPR